MVLLYTYLASVLCAAMCSLYRYKDLDLAARIFSALLFLTFFVESYATWLACTVKNNMALYAIFSPVEFVFISAYFNYSIDSFRSRNIGFKIGAAGFVVAILNIVFIQGLHKMNYYFLIYEGVFIVAMGLFSFLRLLLNNDRLSIHFHIHFWITAILVFFWTVTLLNWSLYTYIIKQSAVQTKILNTAIAVLNIILYSCVSFLFIMVPKQRRKYAN